MMIMLARLVVGLLVLKVAAASPTRHARQVELDTYDSNNYDVGMNLENQDVYDYYDGVTIDEPQIEIGTLAPPEESAVGEEEGEEAEETEAEEVEEVDEAEGEEGEEVEEVDAEEAEAEEGEEVDVEEVEAEEVGCGSSCGGREVDVEQFDAEEAEAEEGEEVDVEEVEAEEVDVEQFDAEEAEAEEGEEVDVEEVEAEEVDVEQFDAEEAEAEEGEEVDVEEVEAEEVDVEQFDAEEAEAEEGEEVRLLGFESLMGPTRRGVWEEELRLTPIDILQISGDLGESGEASGASGDAGGSGASGDFGSGVFSGASGDFGSGGSGGSGASSGEEPSEASGEIEYSGISGEFSGEASGTSGDFGTEASGTSGDLGSAGSGVSGDLGSGASGSGSGSGIVLVPDGEEELPLVPDLPEEASGASAEESGEPESGEEEVIVVPTIVEEDELLPTVPTTPEEVTGGVVGSGESGSPDIDIDIDSTEGMSTCMLCTCLGGSVYCDDVKLQSVPPLPKDTTHFYARYNKITKINKSDFANMNKLKRIDLTSNEIGRVDDDAFFGLPALQELVVRENRLVHLPALPASMTLIDASINKLGSTGIQKEAFKDMAGLLYLYLTDNNIDYVPVPLPDSLRSLHLQNNNIQMLHEDTFCNVKDLHYIRYALEDVRLDGNPLNLSRTPHAYVCLPRIPIGALI
ncbi:epiphycan [Alosa alosa]|uniref:epiphycan n=1 Tax=Alosa alosa TaxID=278164 RepID=UPI0020150F10|nr:epiphycan [Alosa alosa]